MRTAKVIALHVGGLGNRIFNSGDTVYESNFPANNFDKLIDGGFIKEQGVKATPEPKKLIEPEPEKPITLDDMDLGFNETKKQKKK